MAFRALASILVRYNVNGVCRRTITNSLNVRKVLLCPKLPQIVERAGVIGLCQHRSYATKKKAKPKGILKLNSLDENEAVDVEEVKQGMEDVLSELRESLAKLSVKVTSASFADVQVELDDGSKCAIKQLGQMATPQPDKIFINLSSQMEAIPKVVSAIQNQHLGLNPQVEGNVVKITIPKITTEFRTKLVKVAKTNAEPSKKSVRYVRQRAMSKAKKTASVSKDEIKRAEKTIESLTSHYIAEVDNLLDEKCKELMGTN